MLFTKDQLKQIINGKTVKDFNILYDALNEQMGISNISNPQRMKHFFAQLCVESGNFSRTVENLNYSAERLLQVFPKYFNSTTAKQYAAKPQLIANRVYSNRYGNGSESSGDGWKYRGRGFIQLTFKSNYDKYGKLCNLDLINNPELARETYPAVQIAVAYWMDKCLNYYADHSDIETITKKINGGLNGFELRKKEYSRISKIIG